MCDSSAERLKLRRQHARWGGRCAAESALAAVFVTEGRDTERRGEF